MMAPLLTPVWAAALDAAIVGVLGVLAVVAGGPLVTAVFRRVDRGVGRQPGRARDGAGAGVVAAAARLRGGTWIGVLERLSIYAGLTAHYPESIAICLAMKGLARYPELKAPDSGAAERFIIGTFVSVLWACGCAGLAHWLVGLR